LQQRQATHGTTEKLFSLSEQSKPKLAEIYSQKLWRNVVALLPTERK